MTDDAPLHAEIRRRCRQRFVAVYICALMAALMSVGIYYSVPMMHNYDNLQVADATIVAVWRDETGKLQMTSEFTDAHGVTHRDSADAGKQGARGDPKVGESIEYLYKHLGQSGELRAFPRGDRIPRLLFGIPLAIFALMGGVFAWIVLRQRSFRLRMLREGRREPGQMHAIAQTSVNIPVGATAGQPVGLWRLEARYFEPGAGTFVTCHSDWMGAPVPVLTPDTHLPPILVDPRDPSRYWLPVGTLFNTVDAVASAS